jgi:hypothetical protein
MSKFSNLAVPEDRKKLRLLMPTVGGKEMFIDIPP